MCACINFLVDVTSQFFFFLACRSGNEQRRIFLFICDNGKPTNISFLFPNLFYSSKYSKICNWTCFQDFSKLNFKHFLHGGVNVTGFDLVNTDEPKVKSFLRRWRTANQVIYPAAGQPLMVISQHIFLTVFSETPYGFKSNR